MTQFTHLNQHGQASMVDVSSKPDSVRIAVAETYLHASSQVMEALQQQTLDKGDVLAVARIAGIQGAKQCSQLIPLCHPLPLSKVSVDFEYLNIDGKPVLRIETLCKTTGKTGVEMEALTAASIAALTVYDMCKALDKSIEIRQTQLVKKSGGKSGDWENNHATSQHNGQQHA